MGNYQTNLKIDHFFEHELIADPEQESIEIVIHLDPPAIRKDKDKVDRVKLRWENNNSVSVISSWSSITDSEKELAEKDSCNWCPKSHMRDFEVMDPGTPDSIKIARGQGIGVIVIEQFACYTKLIYDRNDSYGVIPAVFAIWNHQEDAKKLFVADLCLGYDIILMTKGGIHNLCEKMDQRDKQETKIISNNPNKCEKYDHRQEPMVISLETLTTVEEKFIHSYLELIKSGLTEKGIYPHLIITKTNQDKIKICWIDMHEAKDVWVQVMKIWKDLESGKVTQMVFGLDRRTGKDQGTLYDDCLPFIYLNRESGELRVKIGVINYDIAKIGTGEDPVDNKIDWDNMFWRSQLIKEWLAIDCLM